MNIELLNVRIFITKNEVTVDAIGNHKASWVPYYSCYATVSAEAGKEDTDAGMIVDNTKVDFTIRWYKKAAVLDSTHYRVAFNDMCLRQRAMSQRSRSLQRSLRRQ